MLLRQAAVCALLLAWASAGSSKPARIPMIATTTSSSINVKARPITTAIPPATGAVASAAAKARRLVEVEAEREAGAEVKFIWAVLGLRHVDHRFNDAGLRLNPVREHANEIVEARVVRDPGARVDASAFN